MWENIKYNLLHHWTFMRGLRLFLGILAIGQWISSSEILIGIAGVILLSQSLLNMGCCSTGACIPARKSRYRPQATETIEYEEIK